MSEKSKYVFVWSNFQSLLTIEMNIEAASVLKENIWNDIEDIFEVAEDNVVRCFYGFDDIEHDKERGASFLDDTYFKQFQNDVENEKKVSWEFFSELRNIHFSELSNVEIMSLLRKNILQWQKQISIFRATQAAPQDKILSEFQKHIGEKDISQYLHSPFPDIMEREHKDWTSLLAGTYDEKKILEHVYAYPWLVAQHFTWKDVVETMRHRFEEGKKEVSTLIEKTDIQSQNDAFDTLSPEAKKLAEKLSWLSWSRLEVKERWAGLDFYLIPLMEEIARRTGEDIYDLQKYYLSFEIDELLNGKALTREEKDRRKDCFVGILKNKVIAYYSGAEASLIAKRDLDELYKPNHARLIKGITASKGYKKGVVRILGANDSAKAKLLREEFKSGEILVTQMTQPNIVDIARRAGAIVTDEGGMLSHAAVISREFRIPCIVATNIATQVLKDGDLVEVDADNGVVRIIK